MIEQNLIEWLELADTIQKNEIYNKNIPFFIINYLISKFSHFSEIFYFFMILLFFFQIIELNIIKTDISEDILLKIIKYFENIFLFNKLIIGDNVEYIIFIIVIFIFYSLLLILTTINTIYYIKKKKINRLLITINSFINILNIFYVNGPAILILLYKILCKEEAKVYFCPIKGFWNIILLVFVIIYTIMIIITSFITSYFYNDLG